MTVCTVCSGSSARACTCDAILSATYKYRTTC